MHSLYTIYAHFMHKISTYNRSMSQSKRVSNLSFDQLDHPIHMRIYTKVPTKWLLIDTETGQVYRGNVLGYWDKLYSGDKVPSTIPPDFPIHE